GLQYLQDHPPGPHRNRINPQSQPPFAPGAGAPTPLLGGRPSTPGRDPADPEEPPPRCEPQSNQTSEPAPIRTRGGCSYNQYPALGFDARNRDLVLPVGAPPTVRTGIKPNLKASPHSHPTLVLLRWIRGGEVCVGAPPSVRTGQAHIRTRRGCSYNKYANSHPGRLLLPREGVGCLPLTSPAHHLQRHPIPGRVAPAVLLHT